MTLGTFHLSQGFTYKREGDNVILGYHGRTLVVPVTEWASAVAVTSARGETSETYQEAVEFLTHE